MWCPSVSLLFTFGLKCILLDIKMATIAFFLGSFTWNTIFQSELWSILDVDVFLGCSRINPIFTCILFMSFYWGNMIIDTERYQGSMIVDVVVVGIVCMRGSLLFCFSRQAFNVKQSWLSSNSLFADQAPFKLK